MLMTAQRAWLYNQTQVSIKSDKTGFITIRIKIKNSSDFWSSNPMNNDYTKVNL